MRVSTGAVVTVYTFTEATEDSGVVTVTVGDGPLSFSYDTELPAYGRCPGDKEHTDAGLAIDGGAGLPNLGIPDAHLSDSSFRSEVEGHEISPW